MTDTQLVTIAITVLAVMTGTLFNNVRISDMNGRFTDVYRHIDDMRDLLRAEMREGRTEMKSEIAELRTDVKSEIADLRALIERNQETIMRMLADHDQRIARLESQRPS